MLKVIKKSYLCLVIGAILVFSGLAMSGCYSVNVDRERSALDGAYRRQHFFLFGLIREAYVDLTQECPRGVAGFGEKFTIGDVFFTVITAGIYSPRTVIVRCQT